MTKEKKFGVEDARAIMAEAKPHLEAVLPSIEEKIRESAKKGKDHVYISVPYTEIDQKTREKIVAELQNRGFHVDLDRQAQQLSIFWRVREVAKAVAAEETEEK